MRWFATPLASQIGYLIASLTEDNYKSIELELIQLATEYGIEGSVILLRNCLEQVNSRQGEMHNLPLKLDLLARILKTLIHQPNSGSILCEALENSSSFSEGFLENICSTLKFSIPEKTGLALALTDAEDQNLQEEGRSFCEANILEFYENPTSALTESLIEGILEFLHHSGGLTKHVHSFTTALQSLQLKVQESLLLTPLLHENVNEVNCLRSFSAVGTDTNSEIRSLLSTATKVSDVLEELGYNCTVDVAHCEGILGLFPSITEVDVAQILRMVARTHHGLEDLQGLYCTFYIALCNGEQVSSDRLTTWDVDVLFDSMKQLGETLLECNICYEPLIHPVVTLCGHTFCWRHLYTWMSRAGGHHDRCPVCSCFLWGPDSDYGANMYVIPLFESGEGSGSSSSDIPARPAPTLPGYIYKMEGDFMEAFNLIKDLDEEAMSRRSFNNRLAQRVIELEHELLRVRSRQPFL